jgi:luciferase family oxidoreductase group 1
VNNVGVVTALGVLDQSPVIAGSTAAAALRESVDLAGHAERLGYRRYWVAEHHDTAALAGSAPEVLTAGVAARTATIRVGAGGILLSHYPALKVAETFRVLHALFPGRIDLGLGRADAGGPIVVSALAGAGYAADEDAYRQRVVSLLELLDDDGDSDRVRAAPLGVEPPEVWVLGSSAVGAGLAAQLGLRLSFAHFVSPAFAAQIVAGYRAQFRPSRHCSAPQASLAVSVICADTDAEATRLARSDDLWHLTGARHDREPLMTTDEAATFRPTDIEEQLLVQQKGRRIVGAVEDVHDALDGLATACGVDELVVRTVCPDPAARIHSYELLAGAFGIVPA